MVDGLDHSIGMLDKSKERDIYKNYILCDVGDIGSIPVNNGKGKKQLKDI